MLTVLLDSPFVLAALIVLLWFLNSAIGSMTARYILRQDFVEADGHTVQKPENAPSDKPPQKRRQTWSERLPFLLTVVAFSLTLSADPVTREFFGGGVFVMLGAFSIWHFTSLLTARALLHPGAAEGRIRYTAIYVERSRGAYMFELVLFSGIVGILFGSLAFIAGSLFLLAMAVGHYRRARLASRNHSGINANVQTEPPVGTRSPV